MNPAQPGREELMQKFLQFPAETLAEIAVELVLDAARESGAQAAAQTAGASPAFESFTHWLEAGIRDYRFPELRRFRVEGPKSFLMFQNREMEITSRLDAWPESLPTGPTRVERPGGNGREKAGMLESTPTSDGGRFKNLEL